MTRISSISRRLFFAIMGVAALKGSAQFDAMFTQYMFNEMFINPAYAGSREAMNATLMHRQQWVNFPGRPITTSLALHGPLMGNKMGLGLSFLNEKVGAMSRNLIYGNYAYRMKVHKNGNLALGLMMGLETQANNFSGLKVSDVGSAPSDPQFAQNTNVAGMNFGTGVYYNTKSFFAGLSIPRMLDNQAKFSSDGLKEVKITSLKASRFTYYFTVGNIFTIDENLKIRANMMIKAVKNAPMQLDIGGAALIKELVWAGLSYRSNSSMSLLLGVQVNKQFLVNYSFDYTLNKIQSFSAGSHEIVLNYLFSFKGRKITTPRYF
jgi:type IX secretion system PorP/SprF family membrane protein